MRERFRPLEGWSKAVTVALLAVVVVDAFAMWVDVREIELMNRIVDGDVPSLAELEASDDRQAIAGTLLLATFVVATVTFIVWFSRAYRNLEALGATGLRYGKGWAIGAWFVPFLNLVRPKQITNDIWRASDPEAAPDQGIDWREKSVPGFLAVWWGVWIVSISASNLAARLYFRGDDAEDIRNADYLDLVSLGLDGVAAVLAILVASRITRRQSERWLRVGHTLQSQPAVAS